MDEPGDDFIADIKQFVLPDETAAAFLARSHVEPFHTLVPFLDQQMLSAGQVLEIHGGSGSAKTEIIIQVAVSCILPKQWQGVLYGGTEGTVILFDLDCRFNPLRLIQVLRTRIHTARSAQRFRLTPPSPASIGIGEDEDSEMDPLLVACLQRFHLLKCFNSLSFISALKTLRPRLQQLQALGLPAPQLLLIDSIGAHYWPDRAARTNNASAPAAGPSGRPLSFTVVADAVVRELRQLSRSWRLLVVATNGWLSNSSRDANAPGRQQEWGSGLRGNEPQDGRVVEERGMGQHGQFGRGSRQARDARRSFMPAVWQDYITHRLMVQRASKSEAYHHPGELFVAEWERPQPGGEDFFEIKGDMIKLVI